MGTAWEERIIGVFVDRYPVSAAAALSEASAPDEAPGKSRLLRLRPDRIFPGFDRSSPDDRESFLEAAEALENRGILSLIWVRHRKGEDLSALVCRDPELLFAAAKKPSPKTVAENVRAAARRLGRVAEASRDGSPDEGRSAETAFFLFLAENFTPPDAGRGIDVTTVTDLARLTAFLSGVENTWPSPKTPELRGITPRALSVALYGDSKRLETLTGLFNPLFLRARHQGIEVPDFTFLDRSFPETFIAGKILFTFKETEAAGKPPLAGPLVNASGSILGLPLGTILKLRSVAPLAEERGRVLMIENKETFFALAESLPGYTCFLYTAGHPNRAVRALVSLLAECGFALYHAGDLDPDGFLILQELAEIAEKKVTPVRMDLSTFDRYRDRGRKLEPATLRRIGLIRDETRSLPGAAEVIRRIEETGLGVEQEIIDYRTTV
jgi:hypothetical protein